MAPLAPATLLMGLKLHGGQRLELCWWWEAPPSGEPLRFRDPDAARRFVASLCAESQHLAPLRRFLHRGAPGTWSAPDDGELKDRLAMAIVAGRVQVARFPADVLASWDQLREEEAPAPVAAPQAVPLPPAEEICWPCLRAAASARALREASSDGAPFVAQD